MTLKINLHPAAWRFFTLSILLVGILDSATQPIDDDGVCLTAGCERAAAHLLEKIDPTVDPCDDFYQFACGKFIKNAILSDDASTKNMLAIINRKVQEQIRDILAEEHTPNDLNAFKLAKTFYKSCLDEESTEKQGVQPLIDLTKSLGGWPVLEGDLWNESNWNWTDVYTEMIVRGLDLSSLFELRIQPSYVNSTVRRLHIIVPYKLGIQTELLRKGLNDSRVQKYFELMVGIAETLGVNKSQAELELNKSLKLEIKLANIGARTPRIDSEDSTTDKLTINDVIAVYPFFPWIEFFEAILPGSVTVNGDEIVVFETNVFDVLKYMPHSWKKRTLANYLMWRVVKYSADLLTKPLQNNTVAFQSTLTGANSRPPRSLQCTRSAMESFKQAVDSMWLRKHFKEEWKLAAIEISKQIRNEFIIDLNNATWIDEKTRIKAVEKAEAVQSFIAYPDWLLNDTKLETFYDGIELRPDNYFDNKLRLNRLETNKKFETLRMPDHTPWAYFQITTAEALYGNMQNGIIVLAALLQEDLFSPDYPNFLNYGLFGYIIGHEITHGFGAHGSKFDKEGNLVNWWDEDTKRMFENKASCFHKQYANYSRKNTDETELTDDEDIADNGGIKVAYRAYQKYARNKGAEKRLPLLEYTPQQLFWISTASSMCTVKRPQQEELDILTNVHSPEKYRVIGMVSNMPEFADDFNCPIGSKMNPVEKCEIW